MTYYIGVHYTVTDEAITPTGKTELWIASDREQAIEYALYTHQLHNGRAWASDMGVIRCPSCGQIAITKLSWAVT